ncbi:MAG: nucleotide exchange factor GrpE [Chitinophagales bacterium]
MSKKNIEVTMQEMAEKEAKKIVDQVFAESDLDGLEVEEEDEDAVMEDATEKTDKEADKNLSVEQKLAQAQEETTRWKDKFMRSVAEFENYKRRTSRERIDLIKTAGKDVIVNMLPILDDFDRAFKASEKVTDPTAKEALKGFSLIFNKFKTTLEQKGLEVMDAKGKDFDPEYHEALTEIPAPHPDLQGKVIDVLEDGYYLNDKIIRYAKVVVGK